MSVLTRIDQIMELKRWYAEILMEVAGHPEIEQNDDYRKIKSIIRESLEGDSEFEYSKTRKDIEYMASFATTSRDQEGEPKNE